MASSTREPNHCDSFETNHLVLLSELGQSIHRKDLNQKNYSFLNQTLLLFT